MARIDSLNNFLTDIANAIRSKTGGIEPIKAQDFDVAIGSISGGGVEDSVESYMRDFDLQSKLSHYPSLPINNANYLPSEVQEVIDLCILLGGTPEESTLADEMKLVDRVVGMYLYPERPFSEKDYSPEAVARVQSLCNKLGGV